MVVLVAYATDHGSTRGVADRIAGRLQLRGVGAEACAVADVPEVSRYEADRLRRWHRELAGYTDLIFQAIHQM